MKNALTYKSHSPNKMAAWLKARGIKEQPRDDFDDDDDMSREELIQKLSACMAHAKELRDEARFHLAEAIKSVKAMQVAKRIAAVRRSARKKASEVDRFIDNIRRKGRRNAQVTIH